MVGYVTALLFTLSYQLEELKNIVTLLAHKVVNKLFVEKLDLLKFYYKQQFEM